jgi:hypothetical protein
MFLRSTSHSNIFLINNAMYVTASKKFRDRKYVSDLAASENY